MAVSQVSKLSYVLTDQHPDHTYTSDKLRKQMQPLSRDKFAALFKKEAGEGDEADDIFAKTTRTAVRGSLGFGKNESMQFAMQPIPGVLDREVTLTDMAGFHEYEKLLLKKDSCALDDAGVVDVHVGLDILAKKLMAPQR